MKGSSVDIMFSDTGDDVGSVSIGGGVGGDGEAKVTCKKYM